MAYDPRRDRTVLFGGAGEEYYSDLWLWDGASWEELTLQVSGGKCVQPPGLYGASLTWDPVGQRLLLFGGERFDPEEWDVSSEGRLWALRGDCLSPLAPVDLLQDGSPAPRQEHAAAFDRRSGRLLLFGGHDYEDAFADTWAFDGREWELLQPLDPEGDGDPAGRAEHSMAWDPVSERVVLYGGWAGDPDDRRALGDTWAWTGTSWRRLPDERADEDPEPPVPRWGQGLAAHPAAGGLLLFGGRGGRPLRHRAGTWALQGDRWRQLLPEHPDTPAPRSLAPLVWDPTTGELLLHGGEGTDEALDDLWAFRQRWWQAQRLTGPDWLPEGVPSARLAHAGCYDTPSEGVLIFGGEDTDEDPLGDLWLLQAGRFVPLQHADEPGVSGPERLSGPAMASSAATGHLLFGGVDEEGEYPQRAWSWSAGSWHALDPPAECGRWPPGREDAALQPDPDGDGLLLLGGSYWERTEQWAADMWRWDGRCFEPVEQGDPEQGEAPVARSQAGWALDPQRGGLLLYGGSADNELSAGYQPTDTWEWRAGTWSRLRIADPEGDGGPGPRVGPSLQQEPATGTLILFGGTGTADDGTTAELGDTWRWDSGAARAPAHQLSVELGAARLPEGTEATALTVRWWGSGQGEGGPGATLHVWDDGAWRRVAESSGDAETPLSWHTDDPALLERLTGSPSPLSVALTPLNPNGAGWALVRSDYVELRWDYELPEPP